MTNPPSSVVELLQALIRIPSVNPDGDPGTEKTGELACAQWVGEFLGQCGAEVSFEEVEDGRPNVIGRFASQPTAPPKPRLLFAPHTDTVGVGGMTVEPWVAKFAMAKSGGVVPAIPRARWRRCCGRCGSCGIGFRISASKWVLSG